MNNAIVTKKSFCALALLVSIYPLAIYGMEGFDGLDALFAAAQNLEQNTPEQMDKELSAHDEASGKQVSDHDSFPCYEKTARGEDCAYVARRIEDLKRHVVHVNKVEWERRLKKNAQKRGKKRGRNSEVQALKKNKPNHTVQEPSDNRIKALRDAADNARAGQDGAHGPEEQEQHAPAPQNLQQPLYFVVPPVYIYHPATRYAAYSHPFFLAQPGSAPSRQPQGELAYAHTSFSPAQNYARNRQALDAVRNNPAVNAQAAREFCARSENAADRDIIAID